MLWEDREKVLDMRKWIEKLVRYRIPYDDANGYEQREDVVQTIILSLYKAECFKQKEDFDKDMRNRVIWVFSYKKIDVLEEQGYLLKNEDYDEEEENPKNKKYINYFLQNDVYEKEIEDESVARYVSYQLQIDNDNDTINSKLTAIEIKVDNERQNEKVFGEAIKIIQHELDKFEPSKREYFSILLWGQRKKLKLRDLAEKVGYDRDHRYLSQDFKRFGEEKINPMLEKKGIILQIEEGVLLNIAPEEGEIL